MNLLEIFFLATLPAGISIILLLLNRKKVDIVLIKYDENYIPKHDLRDIFKMIKAYKNCSSLTNIEKKLLILTIIYYIVGYITIITWAILFLFFPDYVFGG